MNRKEILEKLRTQIKQNGHIIGTVAGSGMFARYAAAGGADMILALAAGRFRLMGSSSFVSFFCYGNNNDIVMDFGRRELIPILPDMPIVFGLNACDPMISIYEYLRKIKEAGFAGVVNYPTVCLFDGKFREAIEEEGNSYDKEVEAISLAHYLDLFTIAFVHDEKEAEKMVNAGADVICVHFGFTRGGRVGAKKFISIERATELSSAIFKVCDKLRPDVIKMVYGGPANTPSDMQYIYNHTPCMGYIGGSTFDRLPTEKAVVETTRAFKRPTDDNDSIMNKLPKKNDYVEFVKDYIAENYMNTEILLSDLAQIAHVSGSYLSTRFKQVTGQSFTEYLIHYRMEKAKGFLLTENISFREVAEKVGYYDYVQFSKMFKKHVGLTPSQFVKANINTNKAAEQPAK